MAKILVTGGCGFIGSHTIIDLLDAGFDIVNIDNLSNSSIEVVDQIKKVSGKEFDHYSYDLCDASKVKAVFENHPDIDGIIHFAALKSVGDSVKQPLTYFQNNVNSLLNLLSSAKVYDIKYFVFSSSCTVYGNADKLPVTELTPMKEAESPYGRTKQIGEYILEDVARGTNIQCISLRYFNPAGAHPSGLIGEAPTNPAQNLVPIITEVAIGKREGMQIYGDDYQTHDGSCVRDYIHVMDLASAHTKALSFLIAGKQTLPYDVFNVGVGAGTSVFDAIHSFEKVTGQSLNYKVGPRRAGDVVEIFADNSKISKSLGWEARFDLDDIMSTAWEWEKKRTNG
jgi:UDP-glucose 4-epimerase